MVDPTNPIGMRMRAAYYLRSIFSKEEKNQEDQEQIVRALAQGLHDERQGSLMRHEFAYVMGQLRDDRCCSDLEKALCRNDDCVMVRHEAAEALGAIGAHRSITVLKQVMEDTHLSELEETCRIAVSLRIL